MDNENEHICRLIEDMIPLDGWKLSMKNDAYYQIADIGMPALPALVAHLDNDAAIIRNCCYSVMMLILKNEFGYDETREWNDPTGEQRWNAWLQMMGDPHPNMDKHQRADILDKWRRWFPVSGVECRAFEGELIDKLGLHAAVGGSSLVELSGDEKGDRRKGG